MSHDVGIFQTEYRDVVYEGRSQYRFENETKNLAHRFPNRFDQRQRRRDCCWLLPLREVA